MKNKKIISLVCALAMVFSMFSAFTAVNAADKGMALAGDLSKDGKTITLTLSSVGITDKLDNFTFAVNVPDGVTKADLETTVMSGMSATVNVADGVLYMICTDPSAEGVAVPADNKLATAVIKLTAPLAANYVAKLQNDASIKENSADAGLNVEEGTLDAAETTVQKWQDPNKKPDTVERPTPAPTVDPGTVKPVPTDVPVPAEGKGIALSSSMKNNTVTLEAKSVGITDKLDNFTLAVNLPDGITKADLETTVMSGMSATVNVADGVLYMICTDPSAEGVALPADSKIATVVINLKSELAEPFAFTLQNDASIKENSADAGLNVEEGTMTATSTVVKPSGSEVKPVKTEALKSYVGKGYEEAIAAVPDGKDVYLTVDVTDKNGKAAVYGTDYVAEYPAGTKLTEADYKNLIHGYTDANMADVINGLKFNIYNTTNAKHIKTTLNAEDQENQLVDPVDKDFGGKEPTPTKTPAKLTLTAKVEAKKLYVENATSINVDVKSGLHTVKNGDTVEYLIPANDKFIKFFTDADPSTKKVDGKDYKVITKTISNATEDEAPTATSTVNIKALSVTGTTKMLVNYYDGEIEKDEAPVAETSVSVKVQKKTDGGNGSSDDDDDDDDNTGSGPIAGWNGQTGNTALGQFTDLETVDWAKQAITMLAMKGIVSGDGNGLFRPNDNITRAEYCQILIGAINKTNEYADSSFADVPSDAWFYHAVAVASANGIVSGYGDGNFGPYDLITRQDMALMTYKAAQVMNKDMSAVRTMSFADGGAISDYAATAVQTLADAGIINGVSDTEFAPRANATRAQAAKILYDTFVK